MIEKVAIPVLASDVAPCFEVANYFAIVEIENGIQSSKTVSKCGGCEGYGRVRFLIENNINVLVCNGIKLFYCDLLKISGLKVISDIAGSVDNALAAYLSGQLAPLERTAETVDLSLEIPHDDLVCWTRQLFESNGYEVSPRPDHLPFLIDLVAEIKCPVCGKAIRVGICCGAHTYRLAKEIMEFHHISPTEFQAKVYIYPSSAEIFQTCSEYGIELIDPNSEDDYLFRPRVDRIPILRNPINGHEKACLSLQENNG
jgi:predicted Fe-Mo cluster-binding NifX family protein